MSKPPSNRRSKPAPTTNNSKKANTNIPTPFQPAPPSLATFLAQLNPAHVYLTHIDRQPSAHKRLIFIIPLLLNAFIAGLLLWRLWIAAPTYWVLLLTILGHRTAATVDTAITTRGEQIRILLRRTAMFAGDFVLFKFVGPWPWTFFFERPANPVTWRWTLGGFKREEVVVRVSRGWGASDLMEGVKRGEENAFFRTRVLPAVARERVEGRTGYLLQDGSWDLEFEVMLDVHKLVEKGQMRFEEVERRVWVHMEGVGWVVWRWDGGGEDVIEGRRKKVVAFKEELTRMGKEGLFWRWMEIVEEERDQDGGFTADGQRRVQKRLRGEFERQGVDFEELSRRVGGVEALGPEAKG
ncbi:hypothetical protein M433DRAFT_75371 [Acidomyces richmondensis BFW]|nr:MAG: hypothetical protein FE78DRAFT_136403 [Acidomyces sp. 'richmondensis']KYG41682.1 hypothetical protein M433DRAFT_75371 [Acidomyces richmondensis BFW]